MEESTKRLLRDLYDLVDALKSPRCKNDKFRMLWLDKYKNYCISLESLNEGERQRLEDQYKKDFEERYGNDLKLFIERERKRDEDSNTE